MSRCCNCILSNRNDLGLAVSSNSCHYAGFRRGPRIHSERLSVSPQRRSANRLLRHTHKIVASAWEESGRSRFCNAYHRGEGAQSRGYEHTAPKNGGYASIRKNLRDRREIPPTHEHLMQVEYSITTTRKDCCHERMLAESYEEEFSSAISPKEWHADLLYAHPSLDAQMFFQDTSACTHCLSSSTKHPPERIDPIANVCRTLSQKECHIQTSSQGPATSLAQALNSCIDEVSSLCSSVGNYFQNVGLKAAHLNKFFPDSVVSRPASSLARLISKLSTQAKIQCRRLSSPTIVPSPALQQIEDVPFIRWLDHMGTSYGGSLMVLVGLGYWIQGLRCFPWLTANFYLKDVFAVDPGTLQVVQNTVNLPMVAKPLYGIFSDAVYIRGAHRVPYVVIGGCLQVLSWGSIALLPGSGSSVMMIAAFLGLSNLGASVVDVANDALVAECAKKKKSTGELQSFAWFSTAAGGVLGNLFAAMALSHVEFRPMFGIFGMIVLYQVVKSIGVNEAAFDLKSPRNKIKGLAQHTEDRTKQRASRGSDLLRVESRAKEDSVNKFTGIRQQFTDLVTLVSQKDILYPLAWFMASYAMIPTLTGIMFFYQTQHLKVDPSVVGMAKVLGQMGLMGGSAVYSQFLKDMPLRKLLGAIQILLCFCMLFDIILVKRINVELGIPDAMLVLGGSAFVDAINQFKILPFMVLLAQLCPPGKEGSLLAAFMSVQCLATIVSGYFGVTLASSLHISSNDFSGLPLGILVEAMAALLPILWLSVIPERPKAATVKVHDKERQECPH